MEYISARDYLLEAISNKNALRAANLIQKYLRKKTGEQLWKMPGVEEYFNSKEKGYGVRFFFKGGRQSIRFNWKNTSISGSSLQSIDLWDGRGKDPKWHVEFDQDASLVTILPFVAELINGKIKRGEYSVIPPDNLNEIYDAEENMLIESLDPFDDLLDMLSSGDDLGKANIKSKINSRAYTLFTKIKNDNPEFFTKEGRSSFFSGGPEGINVIRKQKDSYVKSAGGHKVRVTAGGTGERFKPDPEIEKIENDIERLTYEQQLSDMEALLKLAIKGVTNAVFVAGRGGTGKTFTVEKVLNGAGLYEGNGYVKIAGSATPIGMYITLFKNRDKVILFDDADSALDTQEGRNLIKAATDTGKKRTLSWMKKSSFIVPHDEYNAVRYSDSDDDEGDEEGEGGGGGGGGSEKYPNRFDFTGKIIFISNLPINKLDPDGALRTRGFMPEIDPTDEEMYKFMEKIVKHVKLEDGLTLSEEKRVKAIGFLRQTRRKGPPDLRKMVRAVNMMAGGDAAGISENEVKRLISAYA